MFHKTDALVRSSTRARGLFKDAAFVLAAGLSAAALAGCDDDPKAAPPPLPPFENPPELKPNEAGVRELRLGSSEVEINGKRYCLRAYNGMSPGPTIRVPAGDNRKVRVNLYNEFTKSDFRETATLGGAGSKSCHDFNLTNLHAHGAHIQPNYATSDPNDPCTGSGCGPNSTYFGDNVLHEVGAGQAAQYRWDLDEDGTHSPGTDWYHPHIHGSTAIQVMNGAAGALIIEGDIDQIPGIAAAKERVMVVTQVALDSEYTTPLKDGEACTEDTLSINNYLVTDGAKSTLINGKLKPRLVAPPNQVERWRMVYASFPEEMGIKLHVGRDGSCERWDVLSPIELTQIARDGITMPQFYKSDTVWVSPGYRVDAMVKMQAEKQTLCLVSRGVTDPLGSVIAVIDVDPSAGSPTEVTLPEESAVAAVAPPTTWMGMVDGQMTQVSCDSVQTIHQKVVLLVPTPGEKPSGLPTGTTVLGACDPKDHMHGIDPDAPVCVCPEPNINCRKFDERRALGYRSDRVMTADTSEKWEIRAFDGHPFHIHINPFVVCPNSSNKEPNFPHWRDTRWVQFEDGPQEFLMHFRKFTGEFVLHCHKLNHEDDGMMERVEICAPGDQECLCQGVDASNNCISQSGCKPEDLRCQFAKAATDAFPLPPPPNPALSGP